MKRVIFSMVLAAMVGAQAPLPPLPDLPMPPSPAQAPPLPDLKGFPVPAPKETKPVPPPETTKPAPPLMELKGFELPPSKDNSRPAPLVPVNPNGGPTSFPKGGVPTYGNDTGKPPPFKLIENNPPPPAAQGPTLKPEGPSLKSEGPFLTPPPSGLTDIVSPGTLTTPSLALSRIGPATVQAGQAFSYELVVRNVGGQTASQAILHERLPVGSKLISVQPQSMQLELGSAELVGIINPENDLMWSLDNIAPGAERRFRIDVQPGRDGEWKSTATLTTRVSSTMRPTVSGSTAQALTVNGPASVPVGHPAVFQFRVTNTTSAALSEPTLRVQLPPGLQHLQGQAIEAPLGPLSPGQSRDVTLEVIALQVGKLNVDASVLCKPNTVASARATLVATEQPILVLKQTTQLAPAVGAEIDFKLEVTNRSGGEVRDLRIADELPEGLQFAGGDNGAQYDQATRTVRWTVGNLAPGQTRQVLFRAVVRGTGPQINKFSARAAGVADAQLQTILRMGGKN